MKTLQDASTEELAQHGDQVGWDDVYFTLDECPNIRDDDLADHVCDRAWSAYAAARPHVQRTWSAMTSRPAFEAGSGWDELFRAVSRVAYERGFVEGMNLKKR